MSPDDEPRPGGLDPETRCRWRLVIDSSLALLVVTVVLTVVALLR